MGASTVIAERFPAKLLLFGEYAVLDGGDALAIPMTNYSGGLSELTQAYREEVSDYATYLIKAQLPFLDNSKLQLLIDAKCGFASNVPIGGGLGSSGVVAAAYYDYAQLDDVTDHLILQPRLARMEAFFHGSSSGFDPLVSYAGQVLLASANGIQAIDDRQWDADGYGHIYLLDSGEPRVGRDIIQRYLDKKRDGQFYRLILDEYLPIQNACIVSFLEQESAKLYQNLTQLSRFQLEHLDFLIPDHIQKIWQSGIDSDSYYMKLCGAGGGGFYLVFSRAAMDTSLISHELISVDL